MKRLVGIGGLVLVFALCFGTWWFRTGDVLDQVDVRTGKPVCAGTSVEGDHTIRAQRGMSCVITVTVSNRSSRTVHVDEVMLPYFGSQGGWVIKAGESTSQRLEDQGVDGALPLDQDLDSGDLLQFGIDLAFRDSGCSRGKDGDTDSVRPWPVVTVSFLGRTVEQDGDGELRFSQVGASRGCQVD